LGGFAGLRWDAALPALLRSERGRVGVVSAHIYPIRGCRHRHSADALIGRLLSRSAVGAVLGRLAPAMRGARAARLPVRVAELNSAACGGVRGVSDVFASALWAPDALFELARHGASGANIHTWSGATYAPFDALARAGVDQVVARPLVYGLLLFARATPFPSRILPVATAAGKGVTAWGTIDASHTVRVVLVNRSARLDRNVRLALPGGPASASVERLLAPGVHAHGHVTLAGERFGADGRLHGRPVVGTIARRGGRYALRLPAASAALVTIGGDQAVQRQGV
jgi:Glycosyl hydrolase family 79 C-terminal beta domain